MPGRQRPPLLSGFIRVIAIACGLAAAGLAVYSVMLLYAAATFAHDSLPGPVVLGIVGVGVGLAALLCGGVARALWTARR